MKMKRSILTALLCSVLITPAMAQIAAPPPADAARATTTPPDYQMVPGDKLRVEVYKDPQLSQSLQIRPDGKITLPLVGDNAAMGMWADTLTWTGRFFIAPNQFSRATDRHLLAFSGSASIQRESKTKRTAPGVV